MVFQKYFLLPRKEKRLLCLLVITCFILLVITRNENFLSKSGSRAETCYMPKSNHSQKKYAERNYDSNSLAYQEPRKPLHPISEAKKKEICPPAPKFQIPKVDITECSAHQVTINDGGRLGNTICQYITLYLLRHVFGIRVSINKWMKTKLRFFKDISLPVQDLNCSIKNPTRIWYYTLYDMLYTKALQHVKRKDTIDNLNLLNESFYIYHNPCPIEIIKEYRNVVHEFLKFQDDTIEQAKKNIQKALRSLNTSRNNSTLITVHVRRSDYLRFVTSHHKTPLDDVYYQRAFNYFRQRTKNPVFVIVSDDPRWCREKLETRDVVVAASRSPITDMAVVSLGDHHIISYGTFSFMGALLGNGTIIHPLNSTCVESNTFRPMPR